MRPWSRERAATWVRRYPAHIALAALTAGLAASPAAGSVSAAIAAGSAALLAALGAPRVALAAAALVLTGGTLGDARLAAIDAGAKRLAAAAPPTAEDGAGSPLAIDARAYLLERPRRSRFGSAAAVEVELGLVGDLAPQGPTRRENGRTERVRLYARAPVGLRWPPGIRPGSELRIRGLARPLPAREPPGAGGPAGGGFDFAAHLRRRGIAGELALTAVRRTGRARGGVAGALDRGRERAEGAIARGLRPREAALARGLVLGQDEAIDDRLRQDFRDAGLGHLLAVSGQNVMLLCALALPLLAFAGLGRRGRVMALLALIAAYVPLAGAGPSLQRAAAMGAAGLLAVAAGRPASRWYGLLLAAAATLALNPRISGDPGWQLSFAAVAGIGLMAPGLRRALLELMPREAAVVGHGPASATGAGGPGAGTARAGGRAAGLALGARRGSRLAARALADGVAITVAATIATVPLLGFHFGTVPLVSLPANVAALPAVAPIMWIGMLQAALGQLGALPGLGPVANAAALALAAPNGLLLRYLADVAERAAALGEPLPFRLSPAGVVLSYALLAAAIPLARRVARRGGPAATAGLAALRTLPRSARAGGLAAFVLALAAASAPAWLPAQQPDALTVSFLDVGQGDATLIQHPDGTAVLFDAGPPEARTARLLKRAGVRRLDVVVTTHPARDHNGGLPDVLEELPVGLLLDGGDGTADPGFNALLRTARRRGARVAPARAGMTLKAGGLSVRILSPPPRAPGPAPEDPNERAVVAVVSAGGFDLFLSADAESKALAPLALPDVDAMKVPHHGSSDPGLPEVLQRLKPEVAAIEVGRNSYGHPAPATLAALDERVPHVYRTDRDGTVRLTVEGGVMRVVTAR